MEPSSLAQLTPLVAVCLVFTICIGGIVAAFLKYMTGKDKRNEELVTRSSVVLGDMHSEMKGLAMRQEQHTQLLSQMLMSGFRQPAARKRRSTKG